MSARVTAAERAALPVARAALESQASAYGMADTIVFALGGAQLLQCPETAANAEHVAKCLVERTEELMAAEARVAALEQQLAAATGATYREGARLLEATGRDDDAVNLLDNMADAHQPGGTAAAPMPSADRVVAYRSLGGRVLRCLAHAPIDLTGFVPVTSEGLPDGGICTQLECGRDLLITPAGGVL